MPTGRVRSSTHLYYKDAHAKHPTEPTTSTGVAVFADDFQSIRTFAHRDHSNIIQWSEFDSGGHYAAHQVPDLFVGDLQSFFRRLR